MKEVKYNSRNFLNKKQGLAAIECDVDVGHYSIYSNVKISDCNRQVNLDFTAHTAKELGIKLAKLNLLIKELFEMEQFILKNKDVWIEQSKKQELENIAAKKKQKLFLDLALEELED